MDRKVAFAARSVVVVVPARRTRVTDAAVRDVVAQLGEDASVRAVREALGGGSLRDVSAALKRAKAAPSERARQDLAADVPEEAALVRALQRLEDFSLEQGAAQEARLADFTGQLDDLQRTLGRLDPSAFLARLRTDLKASVRAPLAAPAAHPHPAPPATPALSPDLARRLDGIELALRQRSSEVPETLRSLENQARDLALLLSERPAPAPPATAALPDALLARLDRLEQRLAQPDPQIPAALGALEARLEALATALAARPAAPRVDLAPIRRDLRQLLQATPATSQSNEHLLTLANNQAALADALGGLVTHLAGAIAALDTKRSTKPAAARTKSARNETATPRRKARSVAPPAPSRRPTPAKVATKAGGSSRVTKKAPATRRKPGPRKPARTAAPVRRRTATPGKAKPARKTPPTRLSKVSKRPRPDAVRPIKSPARGAPPRKPTTRKRH